MTQKEKIEQLENRVQELENELARIKQRREERRQERLKKVTDTEITLTDMLNDDDRYTIRIYSGNLIVEKVGE